MSAREGMAGTLQRHRPMATPANVMVAAVQIGLVAVLLAFGWSAWRLGRTWIAAGRFDRWRVR
jgi:hypothetical protein